MTTIQPLGNPTMESPQSGFVNLLQIGSPIQQTTLCQQQYQTFMAFQQQLQQYQAFQQFQQQQFQPQPSQLPHSSDFVSETQHSPPPQPKKKKRKKKLVRPTTTQERVPWTTEEQEKLADTWISASQDPIEGDSQTYVRAVCYELTGREKQNPDQISLKWRDIRLKRTEFEEIYNNLLNIHKIRSTDFDGFKADFDQFEKITPTRKTFPYVKASLKLKDVLQWKEQTEGSLQSFGSKRSRNPDATS
uniref:Uncharacterized protein n=1 Tax=Lactuca sativa TaxID=4236 RepID=A0A9R1WRN0_LACSA|nr:hypothetical protein LSAT_V11C900501910 [Lactuca sativa]